MKINEFENATYYRVACDCINNDCDCTIEISIDEENPYFMNLIFYKKLMWNCHFYERNWFWRVMQRITGSLTLLFKGYVELEEAMSLREVEHIDNFIQAMLEGRDKLIDLWEKEHNENLN